MQVSSTTICPIGQFGGLRITHNLLFSLLNFNTSNAWFSGTTKEEHLKLQSGCFVLLFLEETSRN